MKHVRFLVVMFVILFLLLNHIQTKGQPFKIVKEINTPSGTNSNDLFRSTTSNGIFYFTATDQNGTELWRTNGTEAGTYMIKDINTAGSSNPANFYAMNGFVYFTANDGIAGIELWRTDGTEAGTTMVADIFIGSQGSQPVSLTKSGPFLYFVATHPEYGREIWRTDGTDAGTQLVADFIAGTNGTFVNVPDFITVNDKAYFVTSINNRIFVVDGNTNSFGAFFHSTIQLTNDLGAINNTLFIAGRNSAGQTVLWKSDDPSSLTQVKIISTTTTGATQLTNCNGILYFNASDGTNGREPWISDGTEAGTRMVKNINPTGDSQPFQFVASGGRVYMTASPTFSNITGRDNELWITDGTEAGTMLVKDIYPGPNQGRPSGTIALDDGRVLFLAQDGVNGFELWESNGTAAGTIMINNFNSSGDGFNVPLTFFTNFSQDYLLVKYNGGILFFAKSADKGTQLYYGKITQKFYVNDNNLSGDVFTTAAGNDANPGTATAPFATITKAIASAQPGDIVYVDAGTYTEQVTIDKGITIIGAGQTLTAILKPGVVTAPPGDFSEIGVIQSTQSIGNVHLKDLSVTGDFTNNVAAVILQTGGSIKNCKLQAGNQGVFIRKLTDAATIFIENNFISGEYIGVNCTGADLTAIVKNNTIETNNANFSVAIFAGLDPGGIFQFTAIGNFIAKYFTGGCYVAGTNVTINQNSFSGTGAQAVLQIGGNPINAGCNWYGSTDAAVIASKNQGQIYYSPFLASGTDNSAAVGFQPVGASCGGKNLYYVNDNSSTDDVFTSAIGSNSNGGSADAPFATLDYAISQIAAGDIIYIDAGTYTGQVTISKAVTITGAGQNLTLMNSTAALSNPPDFNEPGILQSLQGIGEVHINHLGVNFTTPNGIHNILIQGGGSVRNCKLSNGSQGVFFRDITNNPSVTNYAFVESNDIIPNGIGINCQGSRLNTTIRLNRISNANAPGIYAGIFAGLDFGPLPNLNITNNSISNMFGVGLEVNSFTGNYTNNSILGTGTFMRRTSGNQAVATCNWYGTTDQNSILQRIIGMNNVSPWLSSSATNGSFGWIGFVPAVNNCNTRQTVYYVNDNNQTGDVFTTASGNNANTGIASAPLATLQEAVNRAQNGDTIYVDAGTYIENIIINKSIVLRGAKYGQNPGSSLDRGNESIILPAVQQSAGSIIQPTVNNITIDGFLLDGDNPAISGGTLVNGVDVNTGYGIFNNNVVVGSLTAKNNIVKNTSAYGIGLFRTFGNINGPAVSGNLFTQNRVDNIAGRGIVFAYSAYGAITNNYITRCGTSGTWFSQINVANVNNNPGIVSGNYIETGNLGMQSSSLGINASAVYYQNNHIVGKSASALGLSLLIANPSGIMVSNNKFTDLNTGIAANNTGNQSNMMTVTISNNSFENISNLIFNIFNNTYFDARCNWYGSSAAQNFINKLPLTANLDIVPWLTNGTDNDAAIGFQPVPGSCDGYPTLITLNSLTNITCNGTANGTINITASYGKAPFTYTWTKEGDVNFISNEEDPTGLAPGTYKLSILDGNGSNIYITDPQANEPGTIVVTITEPDVLTATASGSNNVCFNEAIGSASVLAAGGTAPYTYLWSNGATTDEISNLPAGVYNVTITDDNGCTITASYQVTQPTQLTASITNSSTACSNIATVNAGGGTPGYTYLWSNGSQSATISGVPVGTYTVTVTDANGCTTSATVNLTVTEAFNPSASVTNVTCFGANNGVITVTNANGTAPFMFSKDGGVTFVPGTLPFSFTNLSTGTYNIAVKDVNGCTGFVSRTVAQPAQLVVSQGTVQSTCEGAATGSISVVVSGGSPAYSYQWTGPNNYSSSQSAINGLAAGNYNVTVTDSKGCTANLIVPVTSFPTINVNANVQNVVCRGDANGYIDLTVTGGTGSGFTYLWTGGVTTQDRYNLVSGNYNVTITDIGSGCTVTRSYSITQPSTLLKLNNPIITNIAGCETANLGSITATATNGVEPYQFKLNNGSYQASGSFTGLAAATYTVWVKDANGCEKSTEVVISDFGSDPYESINNQNNNAKQRAASINIGTIIKARIAENDQDWFKFTTPPGGMVTYTISVTHPALIYSFSLYRNGSNTVRQPQSSTATSKTYVLGGDSTFQLIITGTASLECYSLSVNPLVPVTSSNSPSSPIVLELPSNPVVDVLSSKVYPNPHRGSFTLSIESPEEGAGVVEMYNAAGQMIGERKVNLMKGKGNLVQYYNMNQAVLFYRVRVGKHVVNGKIIGAQ